MQPFILTHMRSAPPFPLTLWSACGWVGLRVRCMRPVQNACTALCSVNLKLLRLLTQAQTCMSRSPRCLLLMPRAEARCCLSASASLARCKCAGGSVGVATKHRGPNFEIRGVRASEVCVTTRLGHQTCKCSCVGTGQDEGLHARACVSSDLLVSTLVARASLPSPPCGCGHIVIPLILVHCEAS